LSLFIFVAGAFSKQWLSSGVEKNVIPQESCFNPALYSTEARCFEHDMGGYPLTIEDLLASPTTSPLTLRKDLVIFCR
jgi:hypothetical protein